jgi:hypothetical protein
MANVTGTFDALKGHNDALIRKMLEMAIYAAPWPTAPTMTTITDTAGTNLTLPDVYTSLGMLSKDDGASWTPNINIKRWGRTATGRRSAGTPPPAP